MRLPSLCLITAFSLCVFSASALESAPAKAEFSSIRLLTGELHKELPVDGVPPAPAKLDAAIELTLDKGWKTYWRSPGDAGFPMTLALEGGSANVASPLIHWPHSTRFVEEWGLEIFGFRDKVLIPVTFTIPDTTQDSKIDLRVSYAVCSDICINQDHQVSLTIPADYTVDAVHEQRIAKAKGSIPAANGTDGLEVKSIRIKSEDKSTSKGVLLVEAALPLGVAAKSDVFIEGPVGFRFPNPDIAWKDKVTAVFHVPYEISPPAKSLYGIPLRLTLVQGNKAVELELTVPARNAADDAAVKTAEEVQIAHAGEEKKESFWERIQKTFSIREAAAENQE